MRKLLPCLGLVLLLGMVTGCATYPGYWTDRGRDAADIFTAAVGVGAGAKARVGPIAPAVILNFNYAGLVGGRTFCGFDKESTLDHGADAAYMVPFFTMDGGNNTGLSEARHKGYTAVYAFYVAGPADGTHYNASYFTQIEVTAGLGGMLKLGFNPGELLDFLLGFAGIDIYGDDLEAKEEAPPPTLPDTAPK